MVNPDSEAAELIGRLTRYRDRLRAAGLANSAARIEAEIAELRLAARANGNRREVEKKS